MNVHGSCHCGQVRYEATVDPKLVSICHCTDCQKLAGTAYRVSVRAQEGTFRLLQGQPSVYVKTAESGAKRAQVFCPDCGSSLYVHDPDDPKIYMLRIGSLDERALLSPTRQIWCRSALPWTQDLSDIEKRGTV